MTRGTRFHTASGAIRGRAHQAHEKDGDAARHEETLISRVAKEQWRNDALQTVKPLLARADLPVDLRPFLESLLKRLDTTCLSKNQWEALQRIATKARLLDEMGQHWDDVPRQLHKAPTRRVCREDTRPMWMTFASLLPKAPPGRKEE